MTNLEIQELSFLRVDNDLNKIKNALALLKDRAALLYIMDNKKKRYEQCLLETLIEIFPESKKELLNINTEGQYMLFGSLLFLKEIIKVWLTVGIK